MPLLTHLACHTHIYNLATSSKSSRSRKSKPRCLWITFFVRSKSPLTAKTSLAITFSSPSAICPQRFDILCHNSSLPLRTLRCEESTSRLSRWMLVSIGEEDKRTGIDLGKFTSIRPKAGESASAGEQGGEEFSRAIILESRSSKN